MNNKGIEKFYLDACATTPLHKSVLEKVTEVQANTWGNPSSIHHLGVKASMSLEISRNIIANKLRAENSDIVFTSGATESIHLAILGVSKSIKPGRIVISEVEHPAVISAALSLKSSGWEVLHWPVDKLGRIRLELIDKLLAEPTKLVSIISGQSEIGTIQPIEIIGKECNKRNIIFHTDATQTLPHGLINWSELPVDLLTASAHKMMGPKGVGLLMYKSKKLSALKPIQGGGIQEHYLRAGTEAFPLIAGFSEAVKLIDDYAINKKLSIEFKESNISKITNELRDQLDKDSKIVMTGHPEYRLPNHISFLASNKSYEPINARRLVRNLSSQGLYVSSGTACLSNKLIDSSVLTAIKIEPKFRQSGIRISLGPWNESIDIDHISRIILDTIYEM